MIAHAPKINGSSQTVVKENTKLHIEKRKCSRVSIRVPISCASLDSKDRLLDHNKGIARNVSQAGLRIEAEKNACSDRLKLAFVDLNKNRVEITGRVVSSHKTAAGTYKIGVQLQGNKPDVIRFVSKLVKFYHYTKKLN
jgi:hypothetical protein